MEFCFNCGRALKDGEKCTCTDVKMSDEMIKNIQANSYDLYDKNRMADLIKNRMIENEKLLERTVELLSQLEEDLVKLDQTKDAIAKLNGITRKGYLNQDTVWKTNERYYEIIDDFKKKVNDIDKF